jgi:hypothetical protein
MLRPTVSPPIFWVSSTHLGLTTRFLLLSDTCGLLMWFALSDERTGLTITIAASPRQRSHSGVRVPWDSRPFLTVSDSRLPFPSISSEFESYVATDGQSASLSWYKAPIWAYDQIFIAIRYTSDSCRFVDMGRSL